MENCFLCIMCTEFFCSNWAEIIKIIIAIIALGISAYTVRVSLKQFRLYKERERSKIFSKLNEMYLSNQEVQAVVKYLTIDKPTKEQAKEPDEYQTELFLRFFEEVCVYMKSDSIEPEQVDKLFGYYLKEIFNSDKGKALIKKCKYQVCYWEYLVEFKNIMSKINKDWSEIPIDKDYKNM